MSSEPRPSLSPHVLSFALRHARQLLRDAPLPVIAELSFADAGDDTVRIVLTARSAAGTREQVLVVAA